MGDEPLIGAAAENAREIARQEVRDFALLLLDEMKRPGTVRADGNIPATAMHDCISEAVVRLERGETIR